MAGRWLITAAENTYTDPTDILWHANPDEAVGDGGFTEAADTALFSALSGNFTLAVAMACQGFQQDSTWPSTLALGVNALDVNGGLQFAGSLTGSGHMSVAGNITLRAGADLVSGWTGALIQDGAVGEITATLTTNAVAIPALTINNAGIGSFTLADDLTVGDLTYTAGKFTTTSRTVTLAAGTFDVAWNTPTYAIAHLIIPDGAKATAAVGYSYANEWTFGSGVGGVSVASAGASKIVLWCKANDSWDQTGESGTVGPALIRIVAVDGNYELGYLDASSTTDGVLVESYGASRSITLTGAWIMGGKALALASFTAAQVATLGTNGQRIVGYPPITLGIGADEDKSGALDVSTGIHQIGAVVSGHAGNTNNAIEFGSGYWEGTDGVELNGDNIACTNTAGHIVAPLGSAYTVDNVDLGGETVLHTYGCTDGGNNTNVDFDKHAFPGSGMLLGVGI